MNAACPAQPRWSRICREESQPGPWTSRTAKLAMPAAYGRSPGSQDRPCLAITPAI